MKKIKEYNKREHLHFIDTLLETEQVEVFINNVIDDMENKEVAVDTLEYLYNELIASRNNLEETVLFLKVCILDLMGLVEQDYYWLNDLQLKEAKDIVIHFGRYKNGDVKFSKHEMEGNKE